jgi:hypothetical protein
VWQTVLSNLIRLNNLYWRFVARFFADFETFDSGLASAFEGPSQYSADYWWFDSMPFNTLEVAINPLLHTFSTGWNQKACDE